MLAAERVQRLDDGLSALGSTDVYDEVFREMAERIERTGSIGKCDIAALTVWKRLRADTRWARALMLTPEADVREATEQAVKASRGEDLLDAAQSAREHLRPLPGLRRGTALASALIAAADPNRFAVYDRRAHAGLRQIDLPLKNNAPRFYSTYMTLVEQCRTEARQAGKTWTARQVDLALFSLGGG